MSRPFVSVVTPTYNRERFFPSLIACYKAQTYPKDRMEWIVLDDGSEKVGPAFLELTKGLPNIRYISLDEKINIGAKRNRLNDEAKGEIIIAMDDDDYYPPERVAHVVTRFATYPQIELAGCSELYMYFTKQQQIIKLGPYGKTHATNGTMAWRHKYTKTHRYDESVTHAEEKSFLDSYKNPLIQLDPFKVMLVISHSENTFNKEIFLKEESPFVKKTVLKIRDFIKDKQLRDFYTTA